jgi:hypothetical protein
MDGDALNVLSPILIRIVSHFFIISDQPVLFVLRAIVRRAWLTSERDINNLPTGSLLGML